MIAPPLRASGILPKRDDLIQSWKLLSPVRPRVSVTSPALGRPGSFLIMNLPSLVFCFSSITSCSMRRPLTSVISLMTTPSNSSPKLWPTLASRSGRAISFLLLAHKAGAAGHLRQAEDDELGRLDRGDADLAQDLAVVDRLGRVGLPVALDVEGLVRREPEE